MDILHQTIYSIFYLGQELPPILILIMSIALCMSLWYLIKIAENGSTIDKIIGVCSVAIGPLAIWLLSVGVSRVSLFSFLAPVFKNYPFNIEIVTNVPAYPLAPHIYQVLSLGGLG